jgi:methyltransferase (TIGR00027 family)
MTSTSDEIAAVARTALGIAVARAAESARADRLFHDPLAADLLAAAGPDAVAFWTEGPGARLAAAMGDYVALRTRYFDDYVTTACAAGCRQVVLVAAGLDTRAFRLRWPAGVRLFELDQPAVLAVKRSVLDQTDHRAGCAHASVPVDLRTDWATPLREHGFRPGEPTAWLVEGLLVYLTAVEADRLLAAISALSAPGSRLAVEYTTRPMLAAPDADGNGVVGFLADLWRNDMSGDPADWLAAHGWRANRRALPDLAAALGRSVPPVFDPSRPNTARITLLCADR